jgi:hypothetical protein
MRTREEEVFRARSYFFYKKNMMDAPNLDDPDPLEDESEEEFDPEDIDFLGTNDYDGEVFNDESIISN